MSKEVKFVFGCLADPLEKQANSQGFTLGIAADTLQKVLFGLQYAYVHDVLTYYQFRMSTDKFYTKLIKPELRLLEDPSHPFADSVLMGTDPDEYLKREV